VSLRIPLTSDQTLQVEFHEVERRLRRLEHRTGVTVAGSVTTIQTFGSGGNGSAPNLNPILARLDAIETALANLPEMDDIDFPVFGGVGGTSSSGAVPEPGTHLPPTGVADHVLKEDATWGFPLRGLVQVTTPGDTTFAADNVNVLGSVGLAGDLSADEVDCRRVLTIDGVSLEGDSYQLRSDLRGLVALATDGTQTQPPYDVVDINAGLHTHGILAADIECHDLRVYGTLSSQEILNRGGAVLSTTGLAAGVNAVVWYAQFPCRVMSVLGYRVGGTGATINAQKNGADTHLSSDLSLTVADTWMSGGAVQNITYAIGDKLEIMIVTVAGLPTQVAIQVDIQRT